MRSSVIILFLFIRPDLFAQFNKHSLRTKVDSLYSKILKEQRIIWIHVPAQPAGVNASKQHYPVLYVLDGEAYTYSMIDILKQLSDENKDPQFNRFIIVGLGNIWNRERDYTPTHVTFSRYMDGSNLRNSGGCANFIAFMSKELIPYIESKYKVTSERTLIGHSLGGLAVIYTLLNHTKLFNHYIAIDPSMWWDKSKLLQQAQAVLPKKNFQDISLFLGISNALNTGADVAEIKKDTSWKNELVRPCLLLADHFSLNKQNKLRFNWKYYKKHNHNTVFPSSMHDGIRFMNTNKN